MNESSEYGEPLSLLRKRHSVRSFKDEEIAPEILRELQADLTMVNSHEAGFHFTLVTDDEDPLKNFSKSYGLFRNARNYLACVVDTSFPDYRERGGFYAEQFAVKATSLGLGSCFVGGTYNPSEVKVQIRADWKILFIVLFGYPLEDERLLSRLMGKLIHRKSLTAREFFLGDDSAYKEACADFPWLPKALEAIACAPSALNKQPVRLGIREKEGGNGEKEVYAHVDQSNPKNLSDLGIAKYNMSLVMPPEGIWEWGNDAPFIQE